VVGDEVYGVKSPYLSRQFLHAHRLGFCLPSTGKYVEFTSKLPSDLEQALECISAAENSTASNGKGYKRARHL
jgi:23S rRNA pseudouridine1911/1915/1917 synthase